MMTDDPEILTSLSEAELAALAEGMTTIAIFPLPSDEGGVSYCAVAGVAAASARRPDRHSTP